MPSILNLKFKGNKSFVPFSNLNDTEALTKTWKVCTKVASFLEQGQRLENMSWRLWHLQNLMVDTDNAKSKREFRKLSKCMGDKLDKEKGRSIEELEAPDFKRNHSVELIQQRAAEKERIREAKPGTIKRMQYTFSIDQPAPAPTTTEVRKPGADGFKKKTASKGPQDTVMGDQTDTMSLKFPSLFSSDFGPAALLFPSPTLSNGLNYGEDLTSSTSSNNDVFSVQRPTIELPLDELLHHMEGTDSNSWAQIRTNVEAVAPTSTSEDVTMGPPQSYNPPTTTVPLVGNKRPASSGESDDESTGADASASAAPRTTKKHTRSASRSFSQVNAVASTSTIPPISQSVREILPETVAPSKVNELFNNPPPPPQRSSGRPSLTVRTQATPTTRSNGPGATATTVVTTHTVVRNSNSAPGGVKAECSNCGATHTPLWRRGLNDELNCNACGLYCKLHKRPRPKSMRNSHGEGRQQAAPRQETVDVMAQCYNCHTTATPLWRKDDEGKTVCNACGLYYKLHGSARPISMKSDVIRKRSRHDARRGNSVEDTSTSPGANSRRNSPVPELTQPTLAPDNSTAPAYDYSEEMDYRTHAQSELIHALGTHAPTASAVFADAFALNYPGPYHPDYITNLYAAPQEPVSYVNVDPVPQGEDPSTSPRSSKRRRMSTDSACEPPQSAVSYYSDGYSSNSSGSAHSQRSSIDFPFGAMAAGPALRGSGNTFWHPPMLPQSEEHSQHLHPPMMPPANNMEVSNNGGNNGHGGGGHSNHGGSPSHSDHSQSPMNYLEPPTMQEADDLFSTYIHPPMAVPEEHSHTSVSSSLGHALHYEYTSFYEHDGMRVQ
ncbi:GATA-binding factor 6-B [Coprinopsis sp. MPI-PUGE-AT-0042]|nr:GATA-binding factor 6-B [Coprinopsis sp. MPI-PUGE-AT-0042]